MKCHFFSSQSTSKTAFEGLFSWSFSLMTFCPQTVPGKRLLQGLKGSFQSPAPGLDSTYMTVTVGLLLAVVP